MNGETVVKLSIIAGYMKKYCAATVLLAWALWDHTLVFGRITKNEPSHFVGHHYFSWTCKLQSYWQAMRFAQANPRAKYLGWNSVRIYGPNNQSELHEFICLPSVDSPSKEQ